MPTWLFHLQNYWRWLIKLTSHRKANLGARHQKTLGQWTGNRRCKPNCDSGNWIGYSPTHQSTSILIRSSCSFSKWRSVNLPLRALSMSATVSGLPGRSISPPWSDIQRHRIMIHMIGSNWSSWKHWNSCNSTSRVPSTRRWFSATKSISNTSSDQIYSPEAKPAGWKLFQLMTLLSSG